MRKIAIVPVIVAVLLACIGLNTVFEPTLSLTTDIIPKPNIVISPLENIGNIPESDLCTSDPFGVASLETGDIASLPSVNGLKQDNVLSDAASYAAFMDSNIDLSKVSVELQTSILTDMINEYKFADDKITLVQGTGNGLTGDISALDELIHKSGKEVSFLAIRLRDGAAAGYNVDVFNSSCSTIKAPMTLYACQLVQQGKLSFNDAFTYNSAAYVGGSGTIQYSDFGTKYRLKTLIKYAMDISDNVAYQMLCMNLGIKNFYNYLKQLGCEVSDEDIEANRYWIDSTARSSALWWSQIYNFKDSGEIGEWYWDLLLGSPSRISVALNNEKDCATKTGSSNHCINEAGIVGGDDPYLVVIYTQSSTSSSNTESYFYRVARAIDALICS